MDKRVAFWTEGGNPIGMGHVARCVNLAKELGARGVPCSFMVNDDPAVRSRLLTESLACEVRPLSCTDALKLKASVVVIDSKKDISGVVKVLKAANKKVLVVENTTADEADAIIMPTPVFDGAYGQAGFFAGAEFIIMGRNFVEARKAARPLRHATPLRVLVTMGGADPNNLTEFVVDSLSHVKDVHLTVAVGPAARPSKRLAGLMKEHTETMRFVTGITDLAPLMARAHVAFTAVGTTVYELAYMGVPSVIIANYESDADYLKVFEALGFCESLGYYKNVRGGEIVRAVRTLIKDSGMWKAMSRSARDLTDGKGAVRIADRIEGLCSKHSAHRAVNAASSF